MSATRKDLSFAQQIAIDRRGDPYVYGGNWDPMDRSTGTDCSGCVIDELDASINGTAMQWRRNADGEGGSTEDFRPPSMGGAANPSNGPFGLIMVNDPSEFPPDAAVLVAFHHGAGGGANSHTWCQVDKLKIETNGDSGTVLWNGAQFTDDVLDVHTIDTPTQYGANNWWYLPGPVAEDGSPIPTGPSPLAGQAPQAPSGQSVTDTLFADVSEFQKVVDDSYPYKVLSIRVCDGTYQDHNFAQNYAWMRAALDSGQLTFGILYTYVRPSEWASNGQTMMAMIDANGGLHPRVALMEDVESGGNPTGDQSGPINNLHDLLAQYAGDPARVIGYGNVSDLNGLWPNKPAAIRLIIAGYGSNPDYPGKVAHQYTDGTGFGDGLPEGASPFGNCDMNSADGLDPDAFAAACGIGQETPVTPPTSPDAPAVVPPPIPSDVDYLRLVYEQLCGTIDPSTGYGAGWPQLGKNPDGSNRYLTDAVAAILQTSVKSNSE